MINGKQKGKKGELELAKILRDYGYETRRSVQYNGKEGMADIVRPTSYTYRVQTCGTIKHR